MGSKELENDGQEKLLLDSLPTLDKELFTNPEHLAFWRHFASWLIVKYSSNRENLNTVIKWIKKTEVVHNDISEGILFREEIDLITKHQLAYPTPWNEKRTSINIPDRKYDSLNGLFYVTIPSLAEKGIVVGMTSGVFDIIHTGHLLFLQKCKEDCDVLVVGVDENQIVEMTKGEKRPFNDFSIRVGSLSELDCVDLLCRIPKLSLTQSPLDIPYMTLFYDLDDETLEKYLLGRTFSRENSPQWYEEVGPNLRFFMTEEDPALKMKTEGAQYMGGKAIVIPKQTSLSTTKIADHFDLKPSDYKPNRFGPDPWWIKQYAQHTQGNL